MKTKTITCKVCGKDKEVNFYVDRIYCSKSCKNKDPELVKASNLARKNTWEKKYGSHPMALDSVQDRHKKKMMDLYGVSHALQNKHLQDKAKETKLQKYGDPNYNNYQKGMETRLDKYGKVVNNHNYLIERRLLKTKWTGIEILDDIETCDLKSPVQVKCKVCSRKWKVSLDNNRIPSCGCQNTPTSHSKGEKTLIQFIKDNLDPDITIIENNRSVLGDAELDVYIPSLGLAFEYNGVYWHSEKYKKKDYHLQKTRRCIAKGIHLVHILESDWLSKPDIVRSMVLNKLNKTPIKVYARNCEVRIITPVEKKQFLNSNHLSGNSNSSINIGLFYEDCLVSVGTFGKPRFDKSFDYELLRFANRLNTSVIGGFSKILKFFDNNYSFNTLLSYADRDWSIGSVYRSNGFRFIGFTDIGYSYTKDGYVFPRQMFQKHKQKDILTKFDPTLTEHQNMLENKYYRLYNTGNLRFIYQKQKEDS